MKTRPSKEADAERLIENAPDTYAKRRAVILREALGQDLIYPSIESAVKETKEGCGEWDARRLHEKFYLLFHEIGFEIASARPSPWREVPDVVLRSLKSYVKGCIKLRKGGNRKYWREDAVLEIAPVEKAMARELATTVAGVRLDAQLAEFPRGTKLELGSADKYAKRKVAAARKLNRGAAKRTK